MWQEKEQKALPYNSIFYTAFCIVSFYHVVIVLSFDIKLSIYVCVNVIVSLFDHFSDDNKCKLQNARKTTICVTNTKTVRFDIILRDI